VRDIALDPDDWQHAVVISSSGVWETTNAGVSWTDRTGNLNNPDLRTVQYVSNAGTGTVLVGGRGGVFRMFTANLGEWGEFGQGLPNAVTFDLEYNAVDNILLAGTLGRGAWTVPNALASILSSVPTQLMVAMSPTSVLEDAMPNLVYTLTQPGVNAGALTVNFTPSAAENDATNSVVGGMEVTFSPATITARVTVADASDATMSPRRSQVDGFRNIEVNKVDHAMSEWLAESAEGTSPVENVARRKKPESLRFDANRGLEYSTVDEDLLAMMARETVFEEEYGHRTS
jgi:hypothetical protein